MPRKRPLPIAAAALAALLALPDLARAGADCPSCHPAKAKDASASSAAARVELADVTLTDQDGARVRLAEVLAGERLVVVDFIFTSCTTVCPVLSASMASLQRRLAERGGAEAQLVSISIDPVRDTPARLLAHRARFGGGPGWTLLGGDAGEVERALRGLGAYAADFTAHAPLVLVGDGQAGRWTRLNGFPQQARILAELDALAAARDALAHASGEAQP